MEKDFEVVRNNETGTSNWKLILIVIIVIISFLTGIIALLVNLSAINSISQLSNLQSSMNKNYSDYGIDENGVYNCSFKENFNGICKIKCIKSCELQNNKARQNICVC